MRINYAAADREAEILQQQLNEGQITQEEYNAAIREIQRDIAEMERSKDYQWGDYYHFGKIE